MLKDTDQQIVVPDIDFKSYAKYVLPMVAFKTGSRCSRAWIRTKIQGSKDPCPAFRRPGNGLTVPRNSGFRNSNPIYTHLHPDLYTPAV